jgi:hypothetical protein
MGPCRILIAGAVQGEFTALLKRLAAVNSKTGPFAALICVGRFFKQEDEKDASTEAIDFVQGCISGTHDLACDIYFMDAAGAFRHLGCRC